jgi:Periplasmic protease
MYNSIKLYYKTLGVAGMDKKELINDFEFVVDKIKSTHPLTMQGLPDYMKAAADELIKKIDDVDSLLMNLCKLTSLLHDGHTNIEIEYKSGDLCLNLPCIWLNDGLFATADYLGALKGDKIISVGNYSIEEIVSKLCEMIPHENEYLVKMRATTYPFINYHFFSEFMLRSMRALKNNEVEITVVRGKETLSFTIPLENYNGFLAFKSNEDFASFRIENDVAVFKLDECIYNDVYIKKLKDFFDMVKQSNIKKIIIDLRENMGGNCLVATEFLAYVDVSSYYFYGVKVRNQNENCLSEINSEKTPINNSIDGHSRIFSGKIFCLVSNKTFSSARIYAAVLKDNDIATIVGEPTGGKPCSCGNPLRFQTPNLGVKFRVSSRYFTRPSVNGKDDLALFPDVIVYPEIDDILNKNDVVLKKAISMCKDF